MRKATTKRHLFCARRRFGFSIVPDTSDRLSRRFCKDDCGACGNSVDIYAYKVFAKAYARVRICVCDYGDRFCVVQKFSSKLRIVRRKDDHHTFCDSRHRVRHGDALRYYGNGGGFAAQIYARTSEGCSDSYTDASPRFVAKKHNRVERFFADLTNHYSMILRHPLFSGDFDMCARVCARV